MAEQEDAPQGGINPNNFVTGLGDYIGARTRRESAAGHERAVVARLEKQGVNKKAFKLFLQLRDMEHEEAELLLLTTLRYCRFAKLPIGAQTSLFASSDDAGEPSTKASEELASAEVYDAGTRAGLAGDNHDSNPHEPGTERHQRWSQGWHNGQNELGKRMWPGDDVTAKPKKKLGARRRSGNPEDRAAP